MIHYQHVRLWRNLRPDDVHTFLRRKGEAWEFTVVTLDKPHLFSNICGMLASIRMAADAKEEANSEEETKMEEPIRLWQQRMGAVVLNKFLQFRFVIFHGRFT